VEDYYKVMINNKEEGNNKIKDDKRQRMATKGAMTTRRTKSR